MLVTEAPPAVSPMLVGAPVHWASDAEQTSSRSNAVEWRAPRGGGSDYDVIRGARYKQGLATALVWSTAKRIRMACRLDPAKYKAALSMQLLSRKGGLLL
jgi:hypothetical protein